MAASTPWAISADSRFVATAEHILERRPGVTGTRRAGTSHIRRNCFTVHYTPKHGNWLNQAEIEIGMFTRHCLGKRRVSDLKTLRREARAWNRQMNRNRVKINWKFDRKAARRKFGYKPNSFKRSET